MNANAILELRADVVEPTLKDYLPLLFQGIPVTLELTFASISLVVVSGFIFGLGRTSKSRLLRRPCGFMV
ncbi:MAG: hypothetical protein ACREP9_12165, partial [Candidatus Dormibacteraceae bacterium]